MQLLWAANIPGVHVELQKPLGGSNFFFNVAMRLFNAASAKFPMRHSRYCTCLGTPEFRGALHQHGWAALSMLEQARGGERKFFNGARGLPH